MPIYEYRCKACDKVFEYSQRMSEDPKKECEECKGELERLISNTSFALKGSGWYKDLYSSKKPTAGGTSSDSSTSGKSSGSKGGDSSASKSSGAKSSGSSD